MVVVDDEHAHLRTEIDLAFFADGGHPCEVAVEESLHLIGEICHDAVLSSICPWNAGILSDYGKKPHNACSPNVNNITYVPHLKTHLGEMHLFRTLLRRPTTIIRYPINHGKERIDFGLASAVSAGRYARRVDSQWVQRQSLQHADIRTWFRYCV